MNDMELVRCLLYYSKKKMLGKINLKKDIAMRNKYVSTYLSKYLFRSIVFTFLTK